MTAIAVTVTITQQDPTIETSAAYDGALELSMAFSAAESATDDGGGADPGDGGDAMPASASDIQEVTQLQSSILVTFTLPDGIALANLVIQHTSYDDDGNITHTEMLYAGDEATETTYLLVGRTVSMRVSSFSTFTLLTPAVSGPNIAEDGEIDIKDAILLQQYLAGSAQLLATQLRSADVNLSASIDEADAYALLALLQTTVDPQAKA